MLKKFFGFGRRAEGEAGRLADSHPDIDISMSYCPECGDEYRADIEQCHVCRISLISGQEKLAQLRTEEAAREKRSMDIGEGDQLVTIRQGKLRDLKPFQVLLARHTIPALLTGESGCAKGWGGPDLQLEVKAQDAQLALEILERDYQESTALASHDLSTAEAVFDDQAASVQCPACGYAFQPTTTTCPECGLSFGE